MTKPGMPGLRGTDHIGFTVPDLAQAVEFFVNVIGCEKFYDLGPFQAEDDWMKEHLGVHPRAVMKKLSFLRCGNGSNFELFEYDSPDQNMRQPLNSDVGGHHLAFYVDDFEAALSHLKAHKVRIMGNPVRVRQIVIKINHLSVPQERVNVLVKILKVSGKKRHTLVSYMRGRVAA